MPLQFGALGADLCSITAHKWGGPILIADKWEPVFAYHPNSDRAIVVGAYSGHGVMLSAYLGTWAADAMLGRREIPGWDSGQ